MVLHPHYAVPDRCPAQRYFRMPASGTAIEEFIISRVVAKDSRRSKSGGRYKLALVRVRALTFCILDTSWQK